ncbi:MAG: TauD/TfdA family dioxygenase [Alphaproteobacteria bacterium]
MTGTRPLSSALGVEVMGLDLRQTIDAATAKALRELWHRHHLLLFRGQNLSEQDQVRVARLFGPISHRGAWMRERDAAHVSNARADGVLGSGAMQFHADHTFFKRPLKALALYAIEVPSVGGDTLFANCVLAYRNLPDALKARIAGLASVQLFEYGGEYNTRVRLADASPRALRTLHPLVIDDPDIGAKVLFAHPLTTAAIPGLSDAETEALLGELVTYIADPVVGYRHAWRVGDLLLWNNMTLQHARTDFDPGERRTLRRTPIAVSETEAYDATAAA